MVSTIEDTSIERRDFFIFYFFLGGVEYHLLSISNMKAKRKKGEKEPKQKASFSSVVEHSKQASIKKAKLKPARLSIMLYFVTI